MDALAAHQAAARRPTRKPRDLAALHPHPLSALFPLMEDKAFSAFVEDVRSNGLREPIVLHEGKILDGRNRYRACQDLGIQPASKVFDGTDPLAHVISANLQRRHLSESQRAMVAARIATLPHGSNRHTTRAANFPVLQTEAASTLNVSDRSIRSARMVLDHAAPEIIAAVEQDIMAVSAAANIAKQPRERQIARLARDQRKADGTARQEDDFYRTPEATTRALLAVERFPKIIWEPACGDGAISRVLEAAGHDVISTDLIDRGAGEGGCDFLLQSKLRARCIITNPPFKLDDEFAIHALELDVTKLAILARLVWLEGQDRYRTLWRRGKLARVWTFPERQTLWHGGDTAPENDGGMTAYAWFVFERDHDGPPQLGWLLGETS